MSFLIYIIGFAILIGGLCWAAATAGVPELYIGIAATIMIGLGIISAVTSTRRRDPAGDSDHGSVTVVKD
jgi:hypothetical protein